MKLIYHHPLGPVSLFIYRQKGSRPAAAFRRKGVYLAICGFYVVLFNARHGI